MARMIHFADSLADAPVMYRCGCCPSVREICGWHCQMQGCARGQHTDACVRGDRTPQKQIPRNAQ